MPSIMEVTTPETETQYFKCIRCQEEKPILTRGGTGYAIDADGKQICYACCALEDQAYMQAHGKIILYLTREGDHYEVSNWPGTLRYRCSFAKRGRHNIAQVRYDVWFFDEHGREWHGYQVGDETQLCHCKRTKGHMTNGKA